MMSIAGVILIANIIAHGVLLVYIQTRQAPLRVGKPWLSATVFLSLLASAT
jgi:hypothetical protein